MTFPLSQTSVSVLHNNSLILDHILVIRSSRFLIDEYKQKMFQYVTEVTNHLWVNRILNIHYISDLNKEKVFFRYHSRLCELIVWIVCKAGTIRMLEAYNTWFRDDWWNQNSTFEPISKYIFLTLWYFSSGFFRRRHNTNTRMHTYIVASLVGGYFLTWPLIGWRLHNQPIKSHIKKLLAKNEFKSKSC